MASPSDPAKNTPDVLRLALKHKWLLAAGLFAGLIVGQLLYMKMGPLYSATAEILVSKKSTTLKDEKDQTVGERGEHIQLIMSPLIVGEAVKKSQLDKLSSFKGEEDVIEAILENLKVRRISGNDRSHTNLLEISFTSKVKSDATRVVSAVVKAYREYLARSQQEHIGEMLKLVNRARVDLKDDLKEKHKAYLEFRKNSPLIWKNGPSQTSQPNDLTNIHQERVIALDGERRDILLRRTSLATKLQALEEAKARGESRETMELLAERFAADDRGAAHVNALSESFSVLKTMEQHLLPLYQEEQKLLLHYGPKHPEVLEIRKKIAATRQFYHKLGIELPADNARPGAPIDPTLQPRVDVAATFIASLRREIAELDTREAELARQFEEEMKKAKDLAVVQVKDQELMSEIQAETKLLDAITNQLSLLNIGKDNAGFTLRMVSEPSEGLDVKRQLKIVGGGAAGGLGLLMGLLYLRALTDTRVKTPEEVQHTLGLPVMGRLPNIDFARAQRHLHSLIDPAVYYFHNPDTSEAEAYRAVRTALFVMMPARNWKVLQVTSAEPHDGKTTLSTCLAVSMAQAGKKVLLIDADLRCPKIQGLFGLRGQIGLSDVLSGEIELPNAIHSTEVDNLSILSAGITPANPAEMLISPRFDEMLRDVRNEYDYVIVDTPPLLAVSDPAELAPKVDGLLLVVRLQKNRAAAIRRAKEILATQGVAPIGVVVTGVEPTSGYGAYNYRSAYTPSTAVIAPPALVSAR